MQNGKLLTKIKENEFYALITADKNLQYQQNLENYQIRIIVINCKNTLLQELLPFVPFVEAELNKAKYELAVVVNKK